MNSLEIRPEILIARIAEMPHSGPTLETFRHFGDPRTYTVDIADLGHEQIYFWLSARPRDQLANAMEFLLSPNSFGPSVELHVFKREGNSQRFPRLTYKTGWEFDVYNPDYPNDYVLNFIRNARTEGTFDPISDEGKWLLGVMSYYAQVTSEYFTDRGINPGPKVLTLDQYDQEFATASQRFLAAMV